MKIKRAFKCAAVETELKEVLLLVKKSQIKGLEIQEILPLMEESSFKERAEVIIEVFKNYSLNSLAYHAPLRWNLDEISQVKRMDLASEEGSYVFDLIEDTIKEAVLVGNTLKIKTEIPVIFHLFGFAGLDEITEEKRDEKLELGEKRLKELKEIVDYYSKKSGLKLALAREINPSDHGTVPGLLDFHPKDIIRTVVAGVGTNLDFAHIWLNILYWKFGRGELPGVDISKKLYPELNLEETVDLLKPSLKIIHLNDAGPGYRKPFEGLEIGKGNLPHSFLVPLICSKLKRDIIGTYEIKYGHKDPESMLRSDQFYRNLFKEKFEEYFE